MEVWGREEASQGKAKVLQADSRRVWTVGRTISISEAHVVSL